MCPIKVTMMVSAIFLFCMLASSVRALEFKYHLNPELERVLKGFANTTKNLRTKLYSIGNTKKGNKLWVIEMTAAKPGKIGIPNVKLIGNIHGNEPVGREMLLNFFEYLRDNYNSSSRVGWLLNNTRIHIMPSLNPDGFQIATAGCNGEPGRMNNDSVDLNRDFPGCFYRNLIHNASESMAVRKWMEREPFILSAALHGGALVANYPYDAEKETLSYGDTKPSPTPDDDVFRHLATVYAKNHPTMSLGCPDNTNLKKFPGGITNGAKWYTFEGSMGDYNYAYHGCMEVTLEISCCKYPLASALPGLWAENRDALLEYCMEANRGVTGRILDYKTRKPIGGANITVSGRNMTFRSHKGTGQFWRILLPGNYTLKVQAQGYYDSITPFKVPNYNNSFPKLTFLNIKLYNTSLYTTTTTSTTTTTTTEKIRTARVKSVQTTAIPAIKNRFDDEEVVFPQPSPSRQSGPKSTSNAVTLVVANVAVTVLNFRL